MPNWCNNTLRLEHTDPAMIQKFMAGFKKGEAMQEFLPCPDELRNEQAPYRGDNAEQLMEKYGATDWYNWCVNNWGSKWDIGGDDEYLIDEVDTNTVRVSFDSAWAPPIAFYEHLASIGFNVEAMYYEPGMCFAGTVTSSDGEIFDDYYEYSDMSSDEVRDTLPSELDEQFGISEQMADWEAEQESDLELDND
jgi:hypothetical protein